MKIVIVGAGNAGCGTALYFSYYNRVDHGNLEVELIFDKDTPPERVGQGTFPDIVELLWLALGIDWHENPIHATVKQGFVYENWGTKAKEGKCTNQFFHPFPFQMSGMHHHTPLFQKVILESGLFKVIDDQRVEDLDTIDADYIFDCRGKPPELNDDYEELVNPVNCCLLGQSDKREANANWTKAIATPDGWTFVIPNTIETTSYGYLFNEDVTTRDEAKQNCLEMFGVDSDDFLPFRKYVAKKPFDGRVIKNGNKLFFLEPLEGAALATYLNLAVRTYRWIVFGGDETVAPDQINQDIRRLIKECERFVLWHYSTGSKYESKFWDYATELTKTLDCERFDSMLDDTIKTEMIDLRSPKGRAELYGAWSKESLKNWYDNAIV